MLYPRILGCIIAVLACAGVMAQGDENQPGATGGWENVRNHLPATWTADGSIDLREAIQQVLDNHPMVFFPGSNDPDNPLVYPVTTGLTVRRNAQVRFGPNAWLLRLPSAGSVVTLEDGACLSGAVIDGNKYSHWPQFEDLGKSDAGVQMHSNHCTVEDVVVFNNPGIAFFSYGSYNKIYRCLAENIGYIDLKYGAMFYQGAWDNWSGDGFYFRGTGNLIKDCEAYDTFRWDFCSSHSGARQNTYVDCRGGDINFRTYGFIDIEGAEGNNRLIRCISPNSHIAIPGSPDTEVIQCMASYISFYDHQNPDSMEMYGGAGGFAPVIDGNITTEGGIVIGGWSSLRNRQVPGAVAPIVTNNRMYKSHSGPSDGYSDWSFSVHSLDGGGIVANNILFEFDDGYTKGPGMNFENITAANNSIVYGEWKPHLPRLKMRYGYVDEEKVKARRLGYALELLEQQKAALGLEGKITDVTWLPMQAQFVKDPGDIGEQAGWGRGVPEGVEKPLELPIGMHWDFTIGRSHAPGWYYLTFTWPDVPAKSDLYLYVAGIDSEAKFFINGEPAGAHNGWNTPSLIPLPQALRSGDRLLLAARVFTPGGMGGIYGPLGLVVAAKGEAQ